MRILRWVALWFKELLAMQDASIAVDMFSKVSSDEAYRCWLAQMAGGASDEQIIDSCRQSMTAALRKWERLRRERAAIFGATR